jgi:hypothetical protein
MEFSAGPRLPMTSLFDDAAVAGADSWAITP